LIMRYHIALNLVLIQLFQKRLKPYSGSSEAYGYNYGVVIIKLMGRTPFHCGNTLTACRCDFV
jgi:hypothetical protein